MKEQRPWPFPSTAHGITRVSLAHVEGKHLSEAPNSPDFKQIEAEENEAARAIVAGRPLRAADLNMVEQGDGE
jgi:hypothetical protein